MRTSSEPRLSYVGCYAFYRLGKSAMTRVHCHSITSVSAAPSILCALLLARPRPSPGTLALPLGAQVHLLQSLVSLGSHDKY